MSISRSAGLQHACLHQHRWGGRQGRGDRAPGGGGDRAVKVPKTRSLLSQRSQLCLAGMRLLEEAQGISDAGSCRARAGQATHAWQLAHGAISVHRRTGRALQAVIASFSLPGGRKMIPPGALCPPLPLLSSVLQHRGAPLAAAGPGPPSASAPPFPSPIAVPRSPHHLVAGPKAACRDMGHIGFLIARWHQGSHPTLQIPLLSILPSERCSRGASPSSHPYQFAEVTLSQLGSGKKISPRSSLHTSVHNVPWPV